MPPKTDKIKIENPFLDKRSKLLPCQKEMVVYWHDEGWSIYALAKMFNVSRRTIQFTLFPERLEKNRQKRDERGGWKAEYQKDTKHKIELVKQHRERKKNLLIKNQPEDK